MNKLVPETSLYWAL